MQIYRTRFADDIVCEFTKPADESSSKVIILCQGLPSIPKKNKVMKFFSEQGYWVFFPRYRGSWESDGLFLGKSPHEDLLDVMNGIEKPFIDLWSGQEMSVQASSINLLGSSFGGAAVLLASQDERVQHVVALSPVVDWTQESKAEPLDWLREFTKQAFGNAYRFEDKDWNKLKEGKFFNPVDMQDRLDGSKIVIVHAEDDDIVPYKSVASFAKSISAKFVSLKVGGHISTSRSIEDAYSSMILEHFS